mgnify:FL=1
MEFVIPQTYGICYTPNLWNLLYPKLMKKNHQYSCSLVLFSLLFMRTKQFITMTNNNAHNLKEILAKKLFWYISPNIADVKNVRMYVLCFPFSYHNKKCISISILYLDYMCKNTNTIHTPGYLEPVTPVHKQQIILQYSLATYIY